VEFLLIASRTIVEVDAVRVGRVCLHRGLVMLDNPRKLHATGLKKALKRGKWPTLHNPFTPKIARAVPTKRPIA
jgi:hypothetical protein